MNTVGADQDVAAHGLDVVAQAVEEMRGHPALVLGEGTEAMAGVNDFLAETLFDRLENDVLQSPAVDRKLRHIVAGIDAANVAPDFLAMAVEIIKHVGADRDVVELLQETEPGEFADRMRQRVD